MDGFAEMMAAAMGGNGVGGGNSMKPITASELDKGFDPIPNLKPGEKVRAKSNRYNTDKMFKNGATAFVHRIGSFDQYENGCPVRMNDFTALFDDGTDEAAIYEFAFDSRRFERVPADEPVAEAPATEPVEA